MNEEHPIPDDVDLHALRSQSHSDEEMAELIDFFIREIESRTERLRQAWKNSASDEVEQIAHHLKGAAAAYGFPAVGEAAAELENALRCDQADLADLHDNVQSLLQLCRRVIDTS